MNQNVSVNGTMILVFGILGFVFCPIFGVVAWIMGNNAINTLDEAEVYDGTERGLASAGRICGLISSLLWLAVLVLKFMVASGGR